MAVIVRDSRWKWPVPYVVNANARSLVQTSIPEINRAAGIRILVERRPEDAPRAHLYIAKGVAQSESIGFKNQRITVSARSKRALIHEILHALGFCHEQFHEDYAWDCTVHDLKEAHNNPKLFLSKSAWNKKLAFLIDRYLQVAALISGDKSPAAEKQKHQMAALGLDVSDPRKVASLKKESGKLAQFAKSKVAKEMQKSILEAPAVGAEQQFMSYLECFNNANIIMSGSCDYDSIMMYDELAKAAFATQEQLPRFAEFPGGGVNKRTLTGDNRGLSNGDKQAIREHIVPDIKGFVGKTFHVGRDKNGIF